MSELDEELVMIFKTSAQQYSRALKEALDTENWVLLRQTAHTIKGSAGSFGFDAVSKQAALVDTAVDEEQIDAVPGLAMDLLAELEKIL